MLEASENASLLDLGCGDGVNTLKYAAKIGTDRICGIELDEEGAKLAEERGICTYRADLNQQWPIESERFDVVVANQVIEHLWNGRLFTAEIYRTLRPTGYAIVSTENLASLPNIGALLLGYQPFSSHRICGLSLGNPLIWHLEETENQAFSSRYAEMGGECLAEHVRVLAYEGLKDIFLSQGFAIDRIVGSAHLPFKGPISRLLARLDPKHSHFLTVKIRKQ